MEVVDGGWVGVGGGTDGKRGGVETTAKENERKRDKERGEDIGGRKKDTGQGATGVVAAAVATTV